MFANKYHSGKTVEFLETVEKGYTKTHGVNYFDLLHGSPKFLIFGFIVVNMGWPLFLLDTKNTYFI